MANNNNPNYENGAGERLSNRDQWVVILGFYVVLPLVLWGIGWLFRP